MKTYHYKKITGHYYCNYTKEWEEDGIEFEYEVEDCKLLPEIVELVFQEYFTDLDFICDSTEKRQIIRDKLSKIIEEGHLIGVLADKYETHLTELFEQEAKENFKG